jgi:chromosome segregation ATPase
MNDIDDLQREVAKLKLEFSKKETIATDTQARIHDLESKTKHLSCSIDNHRLLVGNLQADIERTFGRIVALEERLSIFMKLTENKPDEPKEVSRSTAGHVSTKNGCIRVYSENPNLRDRIIELLNKYGAGE